MAISTGYSAFKEAADNAREEQEETTEGKEPNAFVPPGADKRYTSKPIYSDQLIKHRDTCRFGGVETAVFDLPEQVEEMNEFRQMEVPQEAPEIILVKEIGPQWSSEKNSYLVLLQYRRVYYRKTF